MKKNDKIFKILIVDDSEETIDTFSNFLRKESYDVSFALSGEEALKMMKSYEYDLILLDIKMPPGMDGFSVFEEMKKHDMTKEIPVIFLSQWDDSENIVKGFELGGRDFIPKITEPVVLLARVKTQLELKEHRDNLERLVDKRTGEVEALNQEIIDTQKEIIFTLGGIVETRSIETTYHLARLSRYTYLLACKAGRSSREAEILKLASPIHDIGKIGIPESILNKPGDLTKEESDIFKTHPKIGYDILKKSNRQILKTAAIIAYQHHERWDGSGFPQGLKGEDIHPYARITAIVDAFDTLVTTKRKKHTSLSSDKIIEEFKKEKEKRFDPNLTDVFLENIKEFFDIFEAYPEEY